MNFKIENKDESGNVLFSGTFTEQEATFLLNVGISYLMAQGAMPMTMNKDGDLTPAVTLQ